MTAKVFKKCLIAFASVFITLNIIAQAINVYHPNAAPQLGFTRAINTNSSVAFTAYQANGRGGARCFLPLITMAGVRPFNCN